jgi:hypothetical protein
MEKVRAIAGSGEGMKDSHQLHTSSQCIFQEVAKDNPKLIVWEINVVIVEALPDNFYRIRPVSGYGRRTVHISQLFY